jgi:hypothetical protein
MKPNSEFGIVGWDQIGANLALQTLAANFRQDAARVRAKARNDESPQRSQCC